MKKVVSIFLSLVILILSIPISAIQAFAEEESESAAAINVASAFMEFIFKLSEKMINGDEKLPQDLLVTCSKYTDEQSNGDNSHPISIGLSKTSGWSAKMILIRPDAIVNGEGDNISVGIAEEGSLTTVSDPWSADKDYVTALGGVIASVAKKDEDVTNSTHLLSYGKLNNIYNLENVYSNIDYSDDDKSIKSAFIIDLPCKVSDGNKETYAKKEAKDNSYVTTSGSDKGSHCDKYTNIGTVGIGFYDNEGNLKALAPLYCWGGTAGENMIATTSNTDNKTNKSDGGSTIISADSIASPFQATVEVSKMTYNEHNNADIDTNWNGWGADKDLGNILNALRDTSVDPCAVFTFINAIIDYSEKEESWTYLELHDKYWKSLADYFPKRQTGTTESETQGKEILDSNCAISACLSAIPITGINTSDGNNAYNEGWVLASSLFTYTSYEYDNTYHKTARTSFRNCFANGFTSSFNKGRYSDAKVYNILTEWKNAINEGVEVPGVKKWVLLTANKQDPTTVLADPIASSIHFGVGYLYRMLAAQGHTINNDAISKNGLKYVSYLQRVAIAPIAIKPYNSTTNELIGDKFSLYINAGIALNDAYDNASMAWEKWSKEIYDLNSIRAVNVFQLGAETIYEIHSYINNLFGSDSQKITADFTSGDTADNATFTSGDVAAYKAAFGPDVGVLPYENHSKFFENPRGYLEAGLTNYHNALYTRVYGDGITFNSANGELVSSSKSVQAITIGTRCLYFIALSYTDFDDQKNRPLYRLIGNIRKELLRPSNTTDLMSKTDISLGINFDHAASIARFYNHEARFECYKDADDAKDWYNYYVYTNDASSASLTTLNVTSDLALYKQYQELTLGDKNDAFTRARTLVVRRDILLALGRSGINVDAIGSSVTEQGKELSKLLKDCEEPATGLSKEKMGMLLFDYIQYPRNIKMTISPTLANNTELMLTATGDYFAYLIFLLSECKAINQEIGASLAAVYLLDGSIDRSEIADELSTISNIQQIISFLDSKIARAVWGDSTDFTFDNAPYLTFGMIYNFCLMAGLLTAADQVLDIYKTDQPLTNFWYMTGSDKIALSKNWYTGRAISATYIPMQSNIYDPYTMLDLVPTEWIQDYQYKWGFYRKALYIDTTADSVQHWFVSKSRGQTRVCTLNDLLHPESEITLYLDTSFYNTQRLAEIQDKTYNLYSASDMPAEGDIIGGIGYWISHWGDIDMPNLIKTDGVSRYSDNIFNDTSGMDWVDDGTPGGKRYDQDILTGKEIVKVYETSQEYSPLVGFAMVSNIYRDENIYNKISQISAANSPVFMSSITLPTQYTTDYVAFSTLYNYALLKNLKGMCTVGYDNTLDKSEPVFIDLYGNIVTESGLVIIPAACNATLHNTGDGTFTPTTIGFLASYGKTWKIPGSYNLYEEFMGKFFKLNPKTNEWDIKPQTIVGTNLNWAALSYSSEYTREALYDWYYWDITQGSTGNATQAVNVMHEVLRGAPIENIDFQEENIKGTRADKTGLIAAAKLDAIVSDIGWDDENSILATPTLSYVDNYEVIVTIVFKVLLIVVIVALLIALLGDVVRGKVSWRTLFSCLKIIVVGVGSVLLIPVMFDISYYESNRLLLQDETEYIVMYNMEKQLNGVEVGITDVEEAVKHSKVYMKLDDYKFNWWDHLDQVVFGDTVAIMQEEYKRFLESSFVEGYDMVQMKNDGAYIDVQDLMEASQIQFDPEVKCAYSTVSVDPVASYYSPFYFFLDALLTNMNTYNATQDLYAYSTKIMRGGNVKTIGLCDQYFKSPKFMEDDDQDYLGLYQLFNIDRSVQTAPVFSPAKIEETERSQWNAVGMLKDEDLEIRIGKVHQHMREWVERNRYLIGKVTDETFIKTLALDTAIYYNNLFGAPYANGLEVYQLSNTDLMRLSIANKAETLDTSPMSFARFVYTESGIFGTYVSIFLVLATMLASFVKAIVTVAIMVLLIVSVYIQKILLRKENRPIGGYLITLGVICGTNILYALILKLILLIPAAGVVPGLSIVLQVFVQLGYTFILAMVLIFALRDWRNMGMNLYQPMIESVQTRSRSFGRKVSGKFNKMLHRSSPEDSVPLNRQRMRDASTFGQTGIADAINKHEANTARKNRDSGTNRFN